MEESAATSVISAISFWDFCAIFAVAAMWGCTNPLLRKGAQHAHAKSNDEWKYKILRPLMDLKNLALDWRFSIPFVLNQSGSVLFVVLLAHMPLTVVVPSVNALTFVFTAIVGYAVGEKALRWQSLVGIAFVVFGVAITIVY